MTASHKERKAPKTVANDIWLGPTECAKRCNVARYTWWQWRKAGIAPKPEGLSPGGRPRWRASTIDAWFVSRLEQQA